jgi:hypothetical protein
MSSSHQTMLEANTGKSVMALFWKELCAKYPPGLLEVFLLMAIQVFFFWVPATLLLLFDLAFPKLSSRHKIQSERRQPSWPQIKHCLIHVAVNSVNGTLIQFFVAYYLGFQQSIYRTSPDLPSSKEVVFDFIFACVIREVMFYYAHRVLHLPSIYKYIHKYFKTLPITKKSLTGLGNITNLRLLWPLQHSMHIQSNILLPMSHPSFCLWLFDMLMS